VRPPLEQGGESALAVFLRTFCLVYGGVALVLRIRTSGGMIELSDREAGELRERLRRVASAQPAEETIAVSANASTSVTFTLTQKVVVIDVLAQWMNEPGGGEIGAGLFKLRDALTDDLERE
jgi:hypothetical protein